MVHVSGEQTDKRAAVRLVRLERRQQLLDPGIQRGRVRGLRELGRQQGDIAFADRGDAVLGFAFRMTGHRQQLADDLGIGLAVEAIGVDGPGGPHPLEQGSMNGAAASAAGPEQRAVDVEDDETHGFENRRLGG